MAINKPYIHEFIVCSNIFIRKNGKYLMIRRSADRKWMPNGMHTIGGKLGKNENPFECAIRELKEEAGILAKNIKLEIIFTEIAPYKKEPINWLVFYFSGDYKSGRIKTKTKEGELIWVTPRELLKLDLHSSVRYVIRHILNKKAGTIFGTLHYDEKNTVIKKKSWLNVCMR